MEVEGIDPEATWTAYFAEHFEAGIDPWYADNGVWEVGTPAAGPADCHGGDLCAGTVLNGNYPESTDSRLVSASITLPTLDSGEELALRFYDWFQYGSYSSGQVQISVWDEENEAWAEWTSVGSAVSGSASSWTPKAVDLTPYAGQRVRIGFLHNVGYAAPGWYLDDVQVIRYTPTFAGGFNAGWGDWYAENGVWEVGVPTSGPSSCRAGEGCVGTLLAANYPDSVDSRLVSPTVSLPKLDAGQELQLRFWNWFQYGSYSSGSVQVSVWDEEASAWAAWAGVGTGVSGSSGAWTPKSVDLTPYAGKRARMGFWHDVGYAGAGWFVDALELVKFKPDFDGSFDEGWGDWYAENGVWEVGAPTAGPESCYAGDFCAGTILDANYPDSVDSRLVSPTVVLPQAGEGGELQIRFWNWFAYGSYSSGQVQVSAWDPDTSTWSEWAAIGTAVSGSSSAWTQKAVDATAYAGKTVRIGFLHNVGYAGAGWFVDSVQIKAL